jgi:copper homeostasis protein
MLFEVCVDSVESAISSEQAGAQRIELCDNLVEGGTTPSLGTIRLACQLVSIAVNVIIRPRGGDFYYSPIEFEVMRQDILAAREAGADGIVTGLLLRDGGVDVERTRALVDLARPLPVTFHRAIDLCRDSAEALETLASLGVERILTSGRRATALEGVDCIARLVRQSAGRVIVMAGGGINCENLPVLLAAAGVSEVHFSARETIPSPMVYRSLACNMGKAYTPDEYIRKVTTVDRVRQVVEAGLRFEHGGIPSQ